MKISSRYSKSFYSDRLSDTKYHEIYAFAVYLNKIKNEISKEVNSNLLFYLDMSKFDFQKYLLPKIKDKISSNFVKQFSDDIYTSYQNKFEGINRRIKFEQIYDYQILLYKRNTKEHNKGDFKGISKKYKSTELSVTLTYLARYGNENTISYLLEKFVKETNSEKEKFYATVLDHIYKYGFGRLMKLALSRRERVIKYYSKHPINFTSFTFRGVSRLTSDIISYNENFNSCIKAFINISWLNRGEKLTIPVKYSKDFYKDMKRYTNGTFTSYTLCFEENNQVRIILSYEGEREIPENKSNYVGIDVNSKHNLFQCSNGDTIDYDRKLVETLSKELLKIDECKKRNKDYVVGKRRNHKIKHLERELHSKIKEEISVLCKRFNKQNINHAIFENLTGFEEKCFCKDENDLNYNRRIKLLKLSSLKDEFEHIARKYDISVSLVHSFYTSQQCPICGCIDSENRKSQEEFECIECGYKQNADINASENIKERVVSTVLRDELLKKGKLGNETFEPKKLKREKVKEVLLSFRYNYNNSKNLEKST
jgi:putative transposase